MPLGTHRARFLRLLNLVVFALLLVGCSSSKLLAPTSLSTVSMSALTPSTVTLQSQEQQQFSVTVSGAQDTAIVWNIVDASGHVHQSGDSTVGTVTATGLYTAPTVSTPMSITLYAGAAADTSVSRTAAVTINPQPPPVTVTITPTAANVQICSVSPCPPSSTVSFQAAVTNTANSAVIWQVNGRAGGDSSLGLISNSGVYTAPAVVPTPATVTVSAISQADPAATASASVTITTTPPPVTVSLNQSTVNLVAGQSFDFTATVANAANPGVTWSVTCSVSDCGSVTSTGADTATYIAPSTVASSLPVTVTATSVQDTTRSAAAGVTVSPLIPPSLTITFDNTLTPVHAGSTLTLTAQVNNLPQGTPQPQINWTQNPSNFCIDWDEEGAGFYDNCASDIDDGNDQDGSVTGNDGPTTGTVTPNPSVTTQATYTAPKVIFDATTTIKGTWVGNSCPQSQPNEPFPYVYVIASTVVNGNTLPASACIQVQP